MAWIAIIIYLVKKLGTQLPGIASANISLNDVHRGPESEKIVS
jgi:hypothetical protein